MPDPLQTLSRMFLLAFVLLVSSNLEAQTQTSVRIGENRLDLLSPVSFQYSDGVDFTTVSNSVSGTASGPVTAVALDLGPDNNSESGCHSAQFDNFTAGHIALIQRGGCTFAVKAINAEAAGASGVILFNQGNNPANTSMLAIDLGDAYSGSIPVLSASYTLGEYWAGLNDLQMSIETQLFRGTRAEALLRYCAANQDHCALSVRHLDEGWHRDLNADRLQVTASTYKILSLMAYARAVLDKELDPTTLVAKEEWARFSVGGDGNALANVWERLGEPDHLTLDEMMHGMIRESDNAAPDWLLDSLGSGAMQQIIDAYIEGHHDLPIAINAFFILLNGSANEPDSANRIVAEYADLGDAAFRAELDALLSGAMQGAAYMQSAREFLCRALPWESLTEPCSFGGQSSTTSRRTMLGNHFMRTNSRTMVRLMEGLLDGSLLSQPMSDIVLPHFEWAMTIPEISDDFTRYGFKGGSFGPQNVCNSVRYAESRHSSDRIALALFIRDSLHACGIGLFPDALLEALTLDEDFRTLFRNDVLFDCQLGASHLVLEDMTLTGIEVLEACLTITAGTGFVVASGAQVTLRAGQTVILGSGVEIEAGASFTIEIDPGLQP